MSIVGEFRVPPGALACAETLAAEPAAVLELDRVVAADAATLSPFVYVSGVTRAAFERAVAADGSIDAAERLLSGADVSLYRVRWAERVAARVRAYTSAGGSITAARGTDAGWVLRVRFAGQAGVEAFQTACRERGHAIEVRRLHRLERPARGWRFGLTAKQREALHAAWELGYFELPRETSMAAVADELGISPQSVSDRLRRALARLVGDALAPPAEPA